MTRLATNTADDARGEVLLLRAIILAVTNFTTVLTGLVLVIAKGTVEGSKLAQLVALELVLAFGDGSSLLRISISFLRWYGYDLQSR